MPNRDHIGITQYQVKNMIIIDDTLLFRFVAKETNEQENVAVNKWAEDKKNYDHLKKIYKVYMLSRFALNIKTTESIRKERAIKEQQYRRRRVLMRTFGAVAAAVLFGVFFLSGGYLMKKHDERMIAKAENVISVPAGNKMEITLSDGTKVLLSPCSELRYPVIFKGKERNVSLSGKAYFSVAHNEKQPFVVSTFASDVVVLGTKFNVKADEESQAFNVALVEGSVKVCGHGENSKEMLMRPGETIALKNGALTFGESDVASETCWTQGILNLNGMDFEELMKEMEKVYNVKIDLACENIPILRYSTGELRVSDGIDTALRHLQNFADFTYTKDYTTGVITIENSSSDN